MPTQRTSSKRSSTTRRAKPWRALAKRIVKHCPTIASSVPGPHTCGKCGTQLNIPPGFDPSALCNDCAQETVVDFAELLLAKG